MQRAREVLALVKAGALDGLSIGFRTVRSRVDPVTRVRRIHEVDLWEVSIVTFPLLTGARVSALKDRKYSPDQPRVAAGNPDGGQWTSGSGASVRRSPQGAEPRDNVVLAQGDFGILIAEIPVAGGRRCVYKFLQISVVVPGAANFRCSPMVHWTAVSHGRLLNDNWPR